MVKWLVVSLALALPFPHWGLGAAGASPPAKASGRPREVRAASRSNRALSSLASLSPGLSVAEHAALDRSGAYRNDPVRVLLLGDSITRTLGPGLSHASRPEYGVSIANHATLGCDLDADLEVRISGEPGPATPGCPDWRGEWPFLAAALHPEVVALGLGRWEAVDHYYDGQWVHVGEPVWDQHVAADLRAAISIFRTFGARVVLFTMPYIDPPNRQPDGLAWPENTPTRARAYNAVVRQVAGSNAREVSVVDLNQMLSPEGVFTANLSGVPVRWSDGVHITISGGELLRRKILPEFDRIGLADEAVLRTHR